jgi:O-antigen/teichoic acid export membrane protein
MSSRVSAASADVVPEPPQGDLLDTTAAGPAAVRGGVLNTVAWVGATLVGVASGALLVRHLGVIETGRYGVAAALLAIVAGISDLGLTAITVRELSVLVGGSRDAVARNMLGIRLMLTGAGVIVITVFAAVAGYPNALTLGVGLAGVSSIIQAAQSTMGAALISELKFGWVAAFAVLRAVLTAALVIALILAGAHLVAFLACTIPVSILLLILNGRVSYGTVPMLPSFHFPEWSRLVRDVLPYSLAVAAATLYFYVAVLLVSLLASGKTLGYFSVSVRVIQVLIGLPALAIGAAFPIFSRAARDDRARLAYALGRVFEVCLLAGVLVALTVTIGASVAVKIIAGPKFGPAVPLLAIQGVSLGASFLGAVWANGLLSLHRYREILTINLLALTVGGALVATLVSLDGARGAAIATAAGEFVLAALNGLALARIDPAFRPPLGNIGKIMLATGLAIASTLIDLPALASVAVAGAIYVAAVLAQGLVPEELLEHAPWRRHRA